MIKLLDLFDMINSSPLRIVSSKTGQVLIRNVGIEHLDRYGQLQVICLHPELYLLHDLCCYCRLVASVHEDEFNAMKER